MGSADEDPAPGRYILTGIRPRETGEPGLAGSFPEPSLRFSVAARR